MLDCGTGAHGLGKALVAEAGGAPITGHILISHTHWDHIQGLPFFEPLFNPGNTWHVYGPTGLGTSLSDTLSGQMQYSYFPVSIEQLGGVVDYHDLVEGSFVVNDIKISTHYLNHPALTLGYRIEADAATIVYASDHEPHRRELAHGGDIASNHHDGAHARFIDGADLLIHDSQYAASEYDKRVGWGHSTVEYVVDVARQAGVSRVALFHHDPARTDDDVDALLELARAHAEACGYTGEIFAASEGPRVDVVGDGGARIDGGRSAFVANVTPAIEATNRSVVIAVRTAEVETTLRAAAAAEDFEIAVASNRPELLDIVDRDAPTMVLIEDGALGADLDMSELVASIHERDDADGDEISVVVIGGSGVRPGVAGVTSAREWMVWPSSLVYVRTKLRAWLLRRACRWQNAAPPDNEAQRLATLRDLEVLDTEPEQRFDELTAEASESLDVPVALVSLVDEHRQWFKSRHGIDAAESPRDMSFCAHAVSSGEALQVPDALLDDRFADNPLVKGAPHVRFYAGVPLTMSDGTHAGTLCVLDYRPRLLNEHQLTELERLADEVAKELEAR